VPQILKGNNYRIIIAVDGKKAFAKFETHRIDIALVITDLEMPVQNGAELACATRRVAPMMKILAMSGPGTANALAVEWPNEVASATLRKPFTSADLNERIGQLLSDKPR
jgi:two-component system, cell cycle sensor histidine kinase and response regulator CckA